MSSAAADMERDAAEGAAVAHVPGMDDRIAALKAERQALKRQLQQTSREVKAQAGSISSLCAMFVLVKLY
jgi:capsule polysaccharide export protein KpsE/RkpR